MLKKAANKAAEAKESSVTVSPTGVDAKAKAKEEPADALAAAAENALARAYQNAVNSQQQKDVVAQAVLVQGVATLYAVVTAALGVVEQKTIQEMFEILKHHAS